jgi:hypothetical protein
MAITSKPVLELCTVSSSANIYLKCKTCRYCIYEFGWKQDDLDLKAQTQMEKHLWEAHQVPSQTQHSDSKQTA